MKKDGSIKPIISIICIMLIVIGVTTYLIFYNYTYVSLFIKTDEVTSVEYGAKKYNLKNFIKNTNGEVDVVDDIDTSVVGKHKVKVKLKKFNIVKKTSFVVDVVDTGDPVITFNESDITISPCDYYDIFANINVIDEIDGELTYKANNDIVEGDSGYYTINSDFSSSAPGDYVIEVVAVDKSMNVGTSSFNITVKEPVVYRPVYYNNDVVNSNAGGIVGTAYSLLGSPYVGGGNSPSGFDCSGFVQYVYSLNGLKVNRSAYAQVYDGYEVSYDSMEPGDIILWGYSGGYITHSALYVGGDQMIHAANPSAGVILSSVSSWDYASGTDILHIRRIAS